ncbi:MAG: hypothetical protein UT61_C0050G0002 [Candidatus Woesebacteria bacterium GW2011_GWA1_39_8]|uniref:Uncharacterized protein n=1 Tax=Candidatus Woesebacteria bacterium GW2011_GWA1_39_8 TaxID=1618552 RepID=A0A0G0PKG4_9BACT|nr:MAG: hypothetical protein UT61_C0050G0002 [Candidatus Woesebacteria bacterium GW2011_GWA1_39_8]
MRIKYDQAKGWSSHFTLLIKAILASRGPVAEVGAGFFSTPLLHWMCKSLGRLLITYENEREFYKFAKNFQDKGHKVKFIENWDKMDFRSRWGVVFIDHHPPQRRGVDALNFQNVADYVVMHDTNPPDKYKWRKDLAKFKYQYDWTELMPWASVVSNFHDVTKWDNNILNT